MNGSKNQLKLPYISIITPVFNGAATLKTCIESVIAQNYPNIEHWFIDGFSTDDSVSIIKQYTCSYPHIKYISETDEGIYDAMNKGIHLAKGEWLYFLGSDDELCEGIILGLNDAFNKNAGIIYGNVLINNRLYNGEYNKSKLLKSNICHQAIFTHNSVFKSIGLFNSKFKVLADWDFNIKCFFKGFEFYFTDIVIAKYSNEGYSNTKAVESGYIPLEKLKCQTHFYRQTEGVEKEYILDIMTHSMKDFYTETHLKIFIKIKVIILMWFFNPKILFKLNYILFKLWIKNLIQN